MTDYIYIDETPGNPEPDHMTVGESYGGTFVDLGIRTYDLNETLLLNVDEARMLAQALTKYADRVQS